MNGREAEPEPHPIVGRLIREGSEDEPEDVVALIGFLGPVVGSGDARHRRIYPDVDYQRWLDLPAGAILDTALVDADVPGGRTVVWVTREAMRAPIFDEAVAVDEALEALFADGGMSTWPLLPETRYVAAEMLGLLASGEGAYT